MCGNKLGGLHPLVFRILPSSITHFHPDISCNSTTRVVIGDLQDASPAELQKHSEDAISLSH